MHPQTAIWHLLARPHDDKLGMERAISFLSGSAWLDPEPKPEILPEGCQDRLPPAGSCTNFCLVRPALLIGDTCKAETKGNAYRVVAGEFKGGYSISRRDVAHFMVERALTNWEEHRGQSFKLSY